ncbi:MAG: hypothetical protein HY096_00890 [Nitrospinae bacterium]|nr:hypothetical protein [Nitrospinota bacterium]
MGNKRFKKKIEGLRRQIRQHEDKIKRERMKDSPDEGIIRHWEIEITSFKEGIEKIMRRLKWKY